MKLNKNKLIKITQRALMELGYQKFNDTRTGASGLFVKLINGEFYLTLGLEISRYYNTRFTASFYLSKTTRWSSMWGDIPRESYERVGKFLTRDERISLLSDEFNGEGVIDAWWDGNDEQSVKNFFIAVELSERRFLAQDNLFANVANSSDVAELVSYSSSVIDLMNSDNQNNNFKYQFVPEKAIDDVPLEWFKAAEIVLSANNGILNINTVKSLAIDAWRQNQIKSKNVINKE